MREDFLSWCREQRRIAAERCERLETGKMVVFDQRGGELRRDISAEWAEELRREVAYLDRVIAIMEQGV